MVGFVGTWPVPVPVRVAIIGLAPYRLIFALAPTAALPMAVSRRALEHLSGWLYEIGVIDKAAE